MLIDGEGYNTTVNMCVKGNGLLNIVDKYTFNNAQLCEYNTVGDYYVVNRLTNSPEKGAIVFTVDLSKSLVSGQTYTCFVFDTSTANKYLLRDSINSENITDVISNNVFKFTAKKEINTLLLYYYDMVVGDKIKINNNVVILEGDYTQSLNITSFFKGFRFSGDDDNKIKLISTGRNIATIDTSNKNITPYEDGYKIECALLLTGEQDIFNMKNRYKENQQYTLSFESKILDNSNQNNYRLRIVYTDGTSTEKYLYTNQYTKVTMVSTKGKTIKMITGNYGTKSGDFIVRNVILEEGVTEGEFFKYLNDTKEVDLSNFEFDGGLKKISKNCYDELDSVNCIAIKKIEKFVLNGKESWHVWTNSTGDTVNAYVNYSEIDNSLKNSIKVDGAMVNNRFPSGRGGYLGTVEGFNITKDYFSLSIHKDKLGVSDVNEDSANSKKISEWVSKNNIEIYYELQRPIVKDFKYNINLRLLDSKSHIGSINDIHCDLSFSVPMNTAANLENDSKRISNIETYVYENKDTLEKVNTLSSNMNESIERLDSIEDDINVEKYKNFNFIKNTKISPLRDVRSSNLKLEGLSLVNDILYDNSDWTLYSGDTFAVRKIITSKIKPSTKYTFRIFGMDLNKFEDYAVFASNDCFEDSKCKDNTLITSKSVVPEVTNIHVYCSGGNKLSQKDLEKIKILLVEGDYTSYNLEYFDGLKSLGDNDNNENTVKLVSENKNIYLDDDIFISKPASKWRVVDRTIPRFVLGNNYRISYKSNNPVELKAILTYSNNNEDVYFSAKDIINISSDKGQITRFRLYIEDSDFSTNKEFKITNIQIEEGKNITDYEPHKEEVKTVFLSEPLKGINDTKDCIYSDDSCNTFYNKCINEFNISEQTVLKEVVNNYNILSITIDNEIGEDSKDFKTNLLAQYNKDTNSSS